MNQRKIYQTPKVFSQPKTSKFFENISHGNVFEVKESNGYSEKLLSLLHDIENQGKTV